MICLTCGAQIPDLSMYCPECGAAQFSAHIEEEITLELTDPMKSKVIIEKCDNMTSALSKIRSVTGLSITEARAFLNEMPAVILKNLSQEEAEQKAQELREAGLDAYADHGKKKEETYGNDHITAE